MTAFADSQPVLLNAGRHSMPDEFALTSSDFDLISRILKQEAGIVLLPAKATLVYSRLAKRLRKCGVSTFHDYCTLIQKDIGERTSMIEALTTNTTNFFREPHHFEHLQKHVLPGLIASARAGRRVRIWSSASSSGQEPYSIALSIVQSAPDAANLDLRILATDINTAMVDRGAAGIYDSEETADIPRALASRYFVRHEGGGGHGSHVVATDEIKRLISFRVLNLFDDWPMKGMFDVVFCRNVMIYFDAETQAGLWERISRKVAMGGFLYIGHSERVTGPAAEAFRQVGTTTYAKVNEARSP